jgi:16S rRNA C967 or C1407 C5-methylase (RsmB/RsmF family)
MMEPLPDAFRNMVNREFPEHASEILDGYDQPPPVSIRLNGAKLSGSPLLPAVPWCANGFYLNNRPLFTSDPWWHAGSYYVQEASSMVLGAVVSELLKQHAVNYALDLCAAPGGKSTHLLSVLAPETVLVSNEMNAPRNRILAENLIKWGVGAPVLTRWDASGFGTALPAFFDLIVVDAPCSGEGLFRKQPDFRQAWNEGLAGACATMQHDILCDIWPSLAPGGILVYSTCTLNRMENEGSVRFLRDVHGAEPLSLPMDKAWGALPDDMGGYRFIPGITVGEGFYIAAVQKPNDSAGRPSQSRAKTHLASAGVHEPSGYERITFRDSVWAVKPPAMDLLRWIPERQLVMPGVELEDERKNPAHASVIWQHYQPDMPDVVLDHAQALEYLKHQALRIDAPNGLVTLSFNGKLLGRGKSVPGRINNLYPAAWKVQTLGMKPEFSLSDLITE